MLLSGISGETGRKGTSQPAKRHWQRCLVSAWFAALAAAALVNTALAQNGDAATEPHRLSVPMQAFVEAIQDSLADARKYNDNPPYFLVKRIKLELNVVRSTTAEGQLEFEVPVLPLEISAGGDIASSSAETLSMTLKPAPQTLVGAAEKINLAELMQAVKSALPNQAGSGGLSLTALSYTTRFNLQTSIDGGIKIALIALGAESSNASSQSVEFKLCQTVDLLDCVE